MAYDVVVSEAIKEAAGSDLATLDAGTVSLKGKSAPAPICIVVGDRIVAESSEFIKLSEAHSALLGLIRERETGKLIDAALASCIALSQDVEPGLASFYDAISGRRQDFSAAVFES